jgi:Predicted permeases
MTDDMLRILIGGIGCAFGLHWWLKHLGWIPDPNQLRPGPMRTGFWGMVAGFTSFSVHAGGPPLQVALLPQRLTPEAYAATTVVFFAVVNLAKVAPYYWLDQFSTDVVITALILAPIGPLAVRLGIYLNQRISVLWFYRLCYFALVLTSLRLLSIGLTNQL